MIETYYQDDKAKIYCGETISVLRGILPELRGGVDLIATSPPYNVGMEYEEIIDWRDYYKITKAWIRVAIKLLKPGGIMAINVPKEVKFKKWQIEKYGRRVEKIATKYDMICMEAGLLPRESIVWVKGSEGSPIASDYRMGSDNNLYVRTASEMILLYSKDRYYYDGGTGRRGKKDVPFLDETKDVWWISPANPNGHPCPWPKEIPRRLILMYTLTHKFVPIVVDPFMGGGESLLIGKKLGRKVIGIDKEKKYCELAASRLRQTELDLRHSAA